MKAYEKPMNVTAGDDSEEEDVFTAALREAGLENPLVTMGNVVEKNDSDGDGTDAIFTETYDGMRAATPQQTASELKLGPSDEETAALLAAQRAAAIETARGGLPAREETAEAEKRRTGYRSRQEARNCSHVTRAAALKELGSTPHESRRRGKAVDIYMIDSDEGSKVCYKMNMKGAECFYGLSEDSYARLPLLIQRQQEWEAEYGMNFLDAKNISYNAGAEDGIIGYYEAAVMTEEAKREIVAGRGDAWVRLM